MNLNFRWGGVVSIELFCLGNNLDEIVDLDK